MANKADNVVSMPKQALRVASVLLDRMQLAWRAGLGFDGDRDYYKIFGWKRAVTVDDFRAKYERQDIAKTVVEAYPTATWGLTPEVYETEGAKKPETLMCPS